MLERIAGYLDDLLRNDDWNGVDAAHNGLQVENSGDVNKVAFAVDACRETFDEADSLDADMLVVHHGIVWGSIESVTGQTYSRLNDLVKNDIALYSSHLPLDAHEKVGNNALLLDGLGATPSGRFAEFGGEDVGFVGELPEPIEMGEFVERVEETVGNEATVLDFGPDEVERVGVLTGAGGGYIDEASRAGVDVFVSGEPKHRAHHDAREHGINAVFGGHYHTETFGVEELRRRVEGEFEVDTAYIEAPTKV
ncbi:MAG: Nif3-like dinuclear metal center hexameric protein [Halobacteria archaeon]|nr:Nif3-like dinuclear metal center hexameric protein [Halobacteria archaeon]